MNLKDKIKELRKLVPVAISEGINLLKENNNNIEKCVEVFINNSLDKIVEETKCDRETALNRFIEDKYDINVSISIIKKEMYDANYQPIKGLTRTDLLKVREWFSLEQTDGFYVALAYTDISSVIETLSLVPNLKDVSEILNKAYVAYNKIFEGYSDSDPIAEFVKRNKLLDDDIEFNKNRVLFQTKTIKLNEELTSHIRNIKE